MIFSEYLGIDSDYVIVGLAALVLILFIVTIVNIVQMSKLKKKYKDRRQQQPDGILGSFG